MSFYSGGRRMIDRHRRNSLLGHVFAHGCKLLPVDRLGRRPKGEEAMR